MNITEDQARELMHEWVESESLRGHMESVAAAMAFHARQIAPNDIERWTIAGLLHDFDYEKHPTIEEHPFVGVAHLKERADVDDEIIDAILGHALYSGVSRTRPMAKYLFASDELSGLIVACCKVRPDGIESLQVKSVKKKLKDKSFAAAVSRDDINLGIKELEMEPGDHIQACIDGIRAQRERVGV